MLLALPTELLLLILKNLPLSGIASFRATNKLFNAFVDQHEHTIYRQAAAQPNLKLIPDESILFEDVASLGYTSRFLGGANTWKEFCRRGYEVRNSWLGKAPSRVTSYDSTSADVYRIKVDEHRGFFIVTYRRGGLTVADIGKNRAIWGLSQDYVHPEAHCEYGEGFLIFDRPDSSKEVWRLVSNDANINPPDTFQVVTESAPDLLQQQVANVQWASNARLTFVPHALLQPPNRAQTGEYRFVYPTLLTAAHNTLYLWDVRTGILTEMIDGIQRHWEDQSSSISNEGGNELGEICGVDVNERYALVCGTYALRVFQRHPLRENVRGSVKRPRKANCVLEISQFTASGPWFFEVKYVKPEELPSNFQHWREREANERNTGLSTDMDDEANPSSMDIVEDDDDDGWDSMDEEGATFTRFVPHHFYIPPLPLRKRTWVRNDKVVVSHCIEMAKVPPGTEFLDNSSHFIAAHFSPCGKHIAALLGTGRLAIIPYFERVVEGEVKDLDIRIDIRLHTSHDSSIYLAYEEGRIGVVTVLGIFIIHPTFPHPADLDTPPSFEVQRVSRLNSPITLSEVSCLQMTQTALWLNWEKRGIREVPGAGWLDLSTLRKMVEKLNQKMEDEEVMFEERYEKAVDTGEFDKSIPDVLNLDEEGPENSFVFSVDFGLGSD